MSGDARRAADQRAGRAAMGLRCAECGRPIAPRGASGRFVHRSRGVVAACDLDADHAAVPERDADQPAPPGPP